MKEVRPSLIGAMNRVTVIAIALLMAQARSLPSLFAASQQGRWDASVVRPIERLSDQTLGVVGYGRIGQATGQKARG